MIPVLRQAQDELQRHLRGWMTRHPVDGAYRWTAHSYRGALAQIKKITAALEAAMLGRLDDGLPKAQRLAVQHLEAAVARLSGMFGEPIRLRLDLAAEIAARRAYLVARMRASAARYAHGRGRASVAADMQRMLAADILRGAGVTETVERLVRHGGPRGAVALRGIAGEPGAVVEYIPEGLFARYRHWAQRVVRTELTSAYGAQAQESLRGAADQVPDLRRMWFADAGACAQICQPMAGQVRGIDEPFITPQGDAVQYGGAHPNCGCSQVPWKSDWPRT